MTYRKARPSHTENLVRDIAFIGTPCRGHTPN
jgi:hypothetical protein